PSGLDATMLQQISALDENPGEAARPHQIQPVVVNGEHYLALAGSYERKGPQRGFRYLLLSSDESQLRALAQTRATLVGVSLAGILLSGMIVWFFIRRITRPLLELRDSAEAIGRGDFSRRIERFSNDECGELAVAFNHMIQNLQSSRAELEKTVTTLHATQAQLVQSEKLSAVGQFVAGVAHELNNPLTIVIGYSDLMKQMGLGDQLQKYLDQIGKSAQRCHKIVQNLLSFARQHTPERRPVNINELCDAVAEILVYDLRTSNIEIRKNYQTDLPPILGDPHQLQQVFLNIINNARQAIEAFRHDGQILLTTRSLGPQVELRIKDNGPGISRENLSRIFDPFFTTKPIGKGTGLGLSLSYGIIQEHHGKISVESQPGAGAEFIILFPVAADGGVTANDVRKPSSPPFPPLQGAGQTVLVVDDEEWILSLVQELLTREGYTVETVSSGQAALELLGRKGYDLIISDWKMPGLSGLQIYESLLSRDPAMARRILFMTGDVISESFKGFLQKYSRACLPKPFSLREFQAAVTRMTAGS
ncbi:MAG: hybrid sensor histidine kinase/response regulator, partial [Opitutaceae bacterium]